MPPRLIVCDHPVVQAKLAFLRDRGTDPVAFKEIVDEVSTLVAYEATRDLPLRADTVETPLEKTRVQRLDVSEVIVVAILRAALGMLEGVRRLVPDARIGVLGYERHEETLEPRLYYAKVPPPRERQKILLVDPMLATGGTALAALTYLKERRYSNIAFIGLIGAPQGVKKVHDAHPDIPICLGALDRGLNDKGYILPGLGDAGDRIFGTIGVGSGLAR